jgi:type I restriction enzyme S subunit
MYDLIGMRLYAKGPYIKEHLPGSAIKADHLYRVQTGAFIYNRLFAWKGSFGVVDADSSHGLVSGEFPVFKTSLPEDAYYLWFLFSQPWAWQMLENSSNGATSTSRLRLKEDDLVKFLIPLPQEHERLDLVHEVQKQLSKIAAARSAAVKQLEAVESLPLAVIRHAFSGVS